MIENKKCFSQSNDMTIIQEPLYSILGKYGNKSAGKQILDGTFQCPEGTNIHIQKIIKELKMLGSLKTSSTVNFKLTIEEHIQSWRIQKERMASKETGLHFGHYKTLIQNKNIAMLDLKTRSIQNIYRFIPSKWKEITDVELLKKKEFMT